MADVAKLLDQVGKKAAEIRKQAKLLQGRDEATGRFMRRDLLLRYALTQSMEVTTLLREIAKEEGIDIRPEEGR